MELVVQHGINALSLGSVYALLALGIALIFGIMQLINFAHGELIMVGGYGLFSLGGIASPLLITLSIVLVVLFALAMERAAFRPVRGAHPSTLLVTSFAVSYLLQNLAILIYSSRPKTTSIVPSLSESVSIGDISVTKLSLVTLAVTIVLLLGLVVFLRKTAIGIQMRASAENFRMARLLGVPANRVIAAAFVLTGGLAGVGAVLLVAQTGTITPDMGLAPVLIAFVATIIGGMGSLLGAVFGGLLLGATTIALDVGLPYGARPWRDAVLFTAVILVLLLRPQGLVAGTAAKTSRI